MSIGLTFISHSALAQAPQGSIQAALEHAKANAQSLGLAPADVETLVVEHSFTSDRTGVSHVYFRQQIDGIPVHTGLLNVTVGRDGTIIHVANRLVPNLSGRVTGTAAGLRAVDAAAQAARHLNLPTVRSLEIVEEEAGPRRASVIAPGEVASEPIVASLIYFPAASGTVHLAWNVGISPRDAPNFWQVRVDASTGEVLHVGDRVDHDHWGVAPGAETHAHAAASGRAQSAAGAVPTPVMARMPDSYRVFPFPFESPLHGASHTVVANPINAAPAGTYPPAVTSWHTTIANSFTDTRGNNVDAYPDTNNDGTPDASGRPDGGALLEFDFAVDLTQQPSAYTDGAVVNLFYWTNIIHDIVYQYGFNEVSGNFQVNNFGRGGVGGDDVRAEAQDGGGNCNANFRTDPDGTRGRMQMYLCTDGTPNRDGSLDALVIIHEYAHGISNRLTGGALDTDCLDNDEQMGEGWSDIYGIMLTQQVGDAMNDGRAVGTYLFGEAPTGNGIRARLYSPDMSVNEFTYDRIKLTGTSPHALGHVWATMLWDLNWALIGDLFPEEGGGSGGGYVAGFNPDWYGGNGGNNLALQLITDGMKMQPCSPGFVDGRDAILAADQALTGGANERTIWKVFARRGLGWSANQGLTTSRTDGTEAFDMPPSLNRPPVADAGVAETLECAAPGGTEVTLDGTGSTDPDFDDPTPDFLTYTWTGPFPEGGGTVTGAEPTVTLAKGVHVITLTVTDQHGEQDTDTVEITIEDTTPPVITLTGPDPQVLECAIDAYVELGATAMDACDGDVTASLSIDASEVDLTAVGQYEVTYTATDAEGNEGEEKRAVEVEDTTPPEITMVDGPIQLWPPDHKYRQFFVDGGLVLSATDACNTNLSVADVVLTEVTSDEKEEGPEEGDGNTMDDILIADACDVLQVRAERAGNLDGRVYTAHVAAFDGYNVGSESAELHVRRDLRRPAIAGVPVYTVEGCEPVAPAAPLLASGSDPDGLGADPDGGSLRAGDDGAEGSLPEEISLDQSYPNPMSSTAMIRFGLPETEHVRISVYDMLGRQVQVLVDEPMSAGRHSVVFDSGQLPAGPYLYRMVAGSFEQVRRMVVMR